VLLGQSWRSRSGHCDALLQAAPWSRARGTDDLGPVEGKPHRAAAKRTAAFCHDRRTADAVVSIRVVGRDAPELVARELRCHLVVGLDSSRGRVTSKRADLQERRRCCRAVQVAVVQDRTGEGALRAASFGCRSITSLARAPASAGQRLGSAVRVAESASTSPMGTRRHKGAPAPGQSSRQGLDDMS